jgi:hypothetical protein
MVDLLRMCISNLSGGQVHYEKLNHENSVPQKFKYPLLGVDVNKRLLSTTFAILTQSTRQWTLSDVEYSEDNDNAITLMI